MIRLAVLLLSILFFVPSAQAEAPAKINKCQMCHGKTLTGKKKAPTLIGLSFEDLLASLTTNIPKKMKRVASKLTDQEKVELSRYISKKISVR